MPSRRLNLILALLLSLCLARLWVVQLPVSFWTDEMVTVFVVHHGANHPSLAVAPQVAQSIYYRLAAIADALFGVNEIAYRIPSILAMGLALWLIARLAARLIHRDAAWFAVFACLGLKSLNTEATDARPYALGICVSAAALLLLMRWLDRARWLDAAGFVAAAALLWRVHLTYWPFYFVFAIYAMVRLARHDTKVTPLAALAVFAMLAVLLLPVAATALSILREAREHVILPPPTLREFADALKWKLLLSAIALGIALRFGFRGDRPGARIAPPALALILGWWLIHPLTLFAFSRITGDSLFVPRYLSLALPGAAMVATLFIPASRLQLAAIIFGLGVLLTVGNWRHPWTAHANSDWRGAARAVRDASTPDTPVICLSPFIEAQTSAAHAEWRPDYPLPGFLYSYLPVYDIRGRAYLFPFGESPQAEIYARALLRDTLPRTGRFLIYGRDRDTNMWTAWFARQPELAGWRSRHLGKFGDVDAVQFEAPR